jgi:hypothetical protein
VDPNYGVKKMQGEDRIHPAIECGLLSLPRRDLNFVGVAAPTAPLGRRGLWVVVGGGYRPH